MIADIAAIVATILAIVALLPQVLKLHRTGIIAGVSATWGGIGAVSNIGWFVYLSREKLWASVPAAGFLFVFYAITVYYVGRGGGDLRPAARWSAGWATALTLILVLGGWGALGIVLGSGAAVTLAPGLWTAYRTRLPRGIAPSTWAITLTGSLLWSYYGLFYEDPGILIYAVTTVTGAALMLARYAATRHRWHEEATTAATATD